MTAVLVLNGPNLGRLGVREPEVYGTASLDDLRELLESKQSSQFSVDLRQTDSEAELVGWLHEAVENQNPVILNPAAFTHYSYALHDAAAQVTQAGLPLIEVHISNPYSRESFRHRSVISSVATGVIAGLGFDSYALALQQITQER